MRIVEATPKRAKPGVTPAVTVLMTAYNEERTIVGAAHSVLGQTRTDFELLVVDDGSTDRTGDLIRSLGDSRIRLHALPRNLGRPEALNVGLSVARAPLIAIMDADDWSFPRRLEAEVGHLEGHPEVDVVGCDYAVLDHIRGESYVRVVGRRHEDLVRALGLFIPLAHGGVVYRREPVVRAGGYRVLSRGVGDLEDLDLWVRLAAIDGRFGAVPELLHVYRISMATSKFRTARGHSERNADHVRLNIEAIRTLGLPKRLYLLAWVRYLYPLLPIGIRRVLRRSSLGPTERALTPGERRAVEDLIAACGG